MLMANVISNIIVSAETHRHLSQAFPLRSLAKTTLKGKSEPLALFGL